MRSNANAGSWTFLVVIIGLAMAHVNAQLLDDTLSTLAPPAPSQTHLRLASMISGNFSSEERVQMDNGQYVDIRQNTIFYPVRINSLGSDTHFYLERTVNGVVIRRHIIEFREDDMGGIVFRFYNLTVQLQNRSLTGPEISHLQDIAFNFLERHGNECDATFHESEKGIFISKYPECEIFPPQRKIYFPFLITCKGLIIDTFVGVSGYHRDKPYLILEAIERYPLLAHSSNVSHIYHEFCGSNNC